MNIIFRRMRSAVLVALAVAGIAPVMAQQPRRVPPEQLPYTWVVTNSDVSVDVPNSGVNIYKPGCVAVTYIIGSDGVPSSVKVAKIVPASDLGSAAVSAVSHFRYAPSKTNKQGEPVSTYYVVPFNAPDDPKQQAAVMAPCKLPGYPPT
jgi:hypothetical protein